MTSCGSSRATRTDRIHNQEWPHDEPLAKLKAAGADDEKYQSLLDRAAGAEEIDAVAQGGYIKADTRAPTTCTDAKIHNQEEWRLEG